MSMWHSMDPPFPIDRQLAVDASPVVLRVSPLERSFWFIFSGASKNSPPLPQEVLARFLALAKKGD